MLLAIVHYHLDPGGVTTVIRSASAVLAAADMRHVILTGGEDDHPHHRHISGLGYLPRAGMRDASRLAEDLRRIAAEALGAPPDVWHFHNHSLGKNALLPAVISQLAAEGERIVLQIHDLAEQGRPDNYRVVADQLELYPFSPRIRHAFLNRRDLEIFTRAGLPLENAALLPNPVDAGVKNEPLEKHGTALLFAPVRGIRRKNLGELVLLSALLPAGARVAISRAPVNPVARHVHEAWRDFAGKHRLPIDFDVVDRVPPAAGSDSDFASWITHASHFVTTSASEGFGLPFLESIAHGKPLIGRDLPHLTEEHAAHGIFHSSLYQHILVPVEWVDLTVLENRLTSTLKRNFSLYRREPPSSHITTILDGLVRDGWLDFGNLPESLQQEVIEKVLNSASSPSHSVPDNQNPPPQLRPFAAVHHCQRRAGGLPPDPQDESDGHGPPLRLIPLTEWLAETLAIRVPSATPASLAPWSPEAYRDRLIALYQSLTDQPPTPLLHVSTEKVLTAHLTPDSFHFLLSAQEPEPYPTRLRAVVFDIYGTLLIAPSGGVKPDATIDSVLRATLLQHGHVPPHSPSTVLHAAVLRHHAAAGVDHPEIDLRVLWREVLGLPEDHDTTLLVRAIENAWHPAQPMPGAEKFIRHLAARGISLGLLSNAQSNTLTDLGSIAEFFIPGFTILSYQHGIAKPSPRIFQILTERLAGHGVSPGETLYIGNDPLHDIVPAAAAGFKTALFTGHPDSLRNGESAPDITFHDWEELVSHALFGDC